MSMAELKSRRSFMSRLPLSSSRGKSLSRQGFSAAAARHLGDIQVTVQNAPSAPKAPRTSVSQRGPVELPEQYTSPYSGLGVSFGAPQDVEMSAATSEGEPGGEADDSADRYPSAVAAPSETDAELSAMLLRAAKEIGWMIGFWGGLPVPPPVPFFPEVHEELVRTWRAPHSSRSRPSSSPLASLDGGAARGYEVVPQVERAVAVHLCPRGAATWRDRPHLPSRACRFSSALAGRAYHAAGHAATALHAMATLQVYQAKVLKHLHEKGSDQGAMEELRAATNFALRATKVTARSLGQVMSTIVVQERHLWLTLAQMADVDKSRFLDAPISQSGLFGDTIEDFAQQFSAVQKQTEAIKHILPRRDIPSTSAGPPPPPARRRGRPPPRPQRNNQLRPLLRCTTPDWQPDVELPAGEGRRPRLRDRSPAKDLRSVPDAGNPEVERIALWGGDNINIPTPGGGPGAAVCSDAAVGLRVGGTHKVTERANFLTSGVQATSSLFEQRPRSVSSDSEPDVASAGTREEGCPTAVTSVNVPLIPLATRLGAWLQLPSPSRWLIRTVRLGYAIQFARRPPRYRGVLSTSVHSDTHAAVLRAEVAVLLAKDAIEPVPPAEMKSGFYSPYFIVPKKSGGLRPILDLRALNRSFLRLPFKMLTTKRMLTCIRPQDWFAAIDLKDAYFHVSILPRHRPFLRFAEGRAISTKCFHLASPSLPASLRDTPDWRFPAVSPPVQPVVRPGLPSGRSPPGTSLQASCGIHGCLFHGLGCCMQRASSIGLLDRTSTAMAYQLPRVVGCASGPSSLPTDVASQARACSHRQHSDCSLHQPSGWSTLPSHVTTRPPSAPMESNVAEIATCRSHSRRTQPCSRPALTAVHPSWRMATPPRDSPANLEPFRGGPDRSVCFPESSHCQRFYSLNEAPNSLGRDALAHSWPPGPKYAFPPVSLLAQTLCKIREDEEQVLLVAPYWPTRTCPSLENPLEERPSFSGDGHNLAPAPRSVEPARLVPGRDASDLSGLPQAVIETITQSRAPSTRQAYALRWGLFVDWCSSRGEDPQRCTIAVVLSFLQEKLERRLSPSTLKVYVAAIAAYHDAVDGTSLGKHQLIVRFLRGARRVNPPGRTPYPLGTSPSPSRACGRPHLSHLHSAPDRTGLHQEGRGDLQAFSVDEVCLEFGPGDSHVILRPRPGYVPKVPTTPFRDQVVNLQALPLEEADPASALLCPVRALRIYVDRTRHFRRTEQLFVCFGGQQKGNAVSKQRLAHWVVDAISLSYQNQGEPCPLGVRAHSTRSVASSYALAHGASLADICRAAGWATPNTFARFYNLRVEAVSSRVLT
ncbi:hypothetical protein H4Q32_025622 [Labeo rohita]|uniref:Core-binding (CB) domain-containing protein n=1 Tax=Labeo rohita TaxID=84645 RepID=A0ABQ8L2E9_LABRO|nr:hypothetical protein H4Q32_025622 [Labeo rohita]